MTSLNNISTCDDEQIKPNLVYVGSEILVAILAVIGNALVIYVFKKERRLRRRTNYYIVSLATADLLVGLLGIPFAIMSEVGLPNNLHLCLFTVSLLVVLCTISIFCLLAVSVDRYWAILYPMAYSRNVRTKTAFVIISLCWFAGCVVGFLPLMGWHQNRPPEVCCYFLHVMDYNYLLFLYFGTIMTPSCLLIAFYAHIYSVVLKQIRQIVVINPECKSKNKSLSSGGMVRMLGVQQTNEVRATQNLAVIVLFFMICWIPLYTINCIIAFDKDFQTKVNPTFMLSCVILSHLNSAGNPLLYAYQLRDFRAALKAFFCNLFCIENKDCTQVAYRYTSTRLNPYCHKRIIAESRFGTPIKKTSTSIPCAPTANIEKLWETQDDSGNSSASQDSTDCQQNNALLRIPKSATENHEHFFCASTSAMENFQSGVDFTENKAFFENTDNEYLQVAKEAFIIEAENRKDPNHSRNFSGNSSKSLQKFFPSFVSNIFKNRRKLVRSLSDGGDSSTPKNLSGFNMSDYYSVT